MTRRHTGVREPLGLDGVHDLDRLGLRLDERDVQVFQGGLELDGRLRVEVVLEIFGDHDDLAADGFGGLGAVFVAADALFDHVLGEDLGLLHHRAEAGARDTARVSTGEKAASRKSSQRISLTWLPTSPDGPRRSPPRGPGSGRGRGVGGEIGGVALVGLDRLLGADGQVFSQVAGQCGEALGTLVTPPA